MASQIGTGRAVEVLYDRGPDSAAATRRSASSGYLVGGCLVLTAAHAIDYQQELSADARLTVRMLQGRPLNAVPVLVSAERGIDVALLEVRDPEFSDQLLPVTFAQVDRDSPDPVTDCWAVGFPLVGEGDLLPQGTRRDSFAVRGEILPGTRQRADLLVLQVTSSPRDLPESAWAGMSGAVVFARDSANILRGLGVVSDHYRNDGVSALTLVPITAVGRSSAAADWWRHLGVVTPSALPVMPRIPMLRTMWLPPRLAPLEGREELLAEVHDRLSAPEGGGPAVVVLRGPAGVGKTSIAVEYAYRHKAEFAVIWQFAAHEPATLQAGFRELAARLGAPDFAEADPIPLVHQMLAAHPGEWLLLFENVLDPAAIRSALPPGGRGRVLITSQSRRWSGTQVLKVPPLGEGIAAQYLAGRTGTVAESSAWKLARALGGLPLILETSAAYMQTTRQSMGEYLRRFQERHARQRGLGDLAGYDERIATTWALTVDMLDAEANALLRLLACMPQDEIPLNLLLRPGTELSGKLAPEVAPGLQTLLADPRAAIATLGRYSLISPPHGSAGWVSMHQLVRAVTLAKLPDDQAENWRKAAAMLTDAAGLGDMQLPAALSTPAWRAPEGRAGSSAAHDDIVKKVASSMEIVGRAAEREVLLDTWESVKRDRSHVVGIVGASGMGKSLLADWFVRAAEPACVMRVSGQREETAIAFGVLERIGAEFSTAGRSPAWGTPEPEADPLIVGESLLQDLRSNGETVLILDDAQWADEQSQMALRFAARRMFGCPVLILVIHGDGAELDENWRKIYDSDRRALLRLSGLTPEELIQLAAAEGRFGLTHAGGARLHQHTGGNPFHTRELLAQVPMSTIVYGEGPLPAPRSIADTVLATLAKCATSVQRLLHAAAVLGPDFDAGQAQALARRRDAARSLDIANAAGLVAEVPGTNGQRFGFSHALVHQSIYDSIELARRRKLHHDAAGMLGGSEALRHRVCAANGPDAELAADLEHQAAEDESHGQLALAATRRRRALELSPPGPGRTRRMLAVVEADLIAGNKRTADLYAHALEAWGGDPWWDYVAGYQALLNAKDDVARERLTRALAGTSSGRLPTGAPADLRARIAAQLAILGVVTLSYREMVEYGQIAVDADSPNSRVAAFAWFARTIGLALAGRGAQALADLDAQGRDFGLDVLVARGMVKLWMDDLPGACRHLREAHSRALRGEALRVAQAQAFLGEVEYRLGNLHESLLHTEFAVGNAEENNRFWDYALLHGLACYAAAAQGDWPKAEHHAAVAESNALPGVGRLSAAGARAVIAQARGDKAALLAAAERVERDFDTLEPGVTLFGPLLSEALVQLGRVDEAAAALQTFCGRFEVTGRKSTEMSIARVRGRIAQARGAHPDALTAYDTALDLAESVGLPLETARIQMLKGECLAASGRYEAAAIWLRTSHKNFAKIGANAYRDQALAAIHRFGLSPEAPPDLLSCLTGAERRVALLAAQNLSNEDIATRLSIQVGTVEFHLTRVYRKLGISGRGDLGKLIG